MMVIVKVQTFYALGLGNVSQIGSRPHGRGVLLKLLELALKPAERVSQRCVVPRG